MEPQNTPREEPEPPLTKTDPRLIKIIELRQQGKNWTQISEEVDLDRRTIYDIRGTEAYIQECNKLYESLMADINKYSNSKTETTALEAMKEKGRVLRSLLPSLSVIQHKRDDTQTTKPTKRKTNLYNLFQYLQLTTKQWKLLEEYVTKQNQKTGSHPT